GKIQLVLRGYGDPDTVRTPGATAQAMLQRLATAPVVTAPAPRAAPPPPPRRSAAAPAPEPVRPVAVVPPAPAPRVVRPDSSVVQVYRRAALTQHKVARPDSTPRP
ncbi:MAG: hypothetical protein RLZ32_1474, partial [Gemmatimonadota bacterium]